MARDAADELKDVLFVDGFDAHEFWGDSENLGDIGPARIDQEVTAGGLDNVLPKSIDESAGLVFDILTASSTSETAQGGVETPIVVSVGGLIPPICDYPPVEREQETVDERDDSPTVFVCDGLILPICDYPPAREVDISDVHSTLTFSGDDIDCTVGDGLLNAAGDVAVVSWPMTTAISISDGVIVCGYLPDEPGQAYANPEIQTISPISSDGGAFPFF